MRSRSWFKALVITRRGGPIQLVGLSWLIAVGLAKLTFVAALGLVAGGAVLQRLARRAEERERLSPPRAP